MRTFTYLLFAGLLFLCEALQAQTHTSIRSGNWSDPAVWDLGTAPGSADDVIINTSHSVTVDINTAQCANLQIVATGSLTVPGGAQLTMGPSGGGNKTLTNDGKLTITGALILNGSIVVDNRNALLVMNTGGNFVIDGNDGTTAGSVSDGNSLFTLTANADQANFNNGSTGGTITIVDPPQGNTSYAIRTATNFAVFNQNVTVALGNGSSATGTVNANGFGLYGIISFGNLVIDNPSGANRLVTQNTYIGVMGDLAINSGELRSNNNPIYFNGNLTNNGVLTAYYLIASGQTGTSLPSSRPQTIGGTGLFRNLTSAADASVGGMIINNATPSGTTLQTDNFVVKSLQLSKGPLFIGNNTLVCASPPSVNPNGSWVATNGTGALKIRSINTTPVLFPVGTATSYDPVTIKNTGATDDIGVRVSSTVNFANDESKTVNRQWQLSEATPGGSSLAATFQWNASEEGADFNRTFAYVGHFNGGGWDNFSYGASGGSDPYTTNISGITDLTAFAIGSGSGLSASVADIVESVRTGNWNDPASWNTGRVPASTDKVDIRTGHTITLDADGACGSLGIDGALNAGAHTLSVGTPSSHNSPLTVYGSFANSGGTIAVNGYIDVKSNSHFTMSGGAISINGNDGSTSTSVDGDHALLNFDQNAISSITGGIFTIVNPHLLVNGSSIGGYLPAFGDSSHLQFGDGVSAQTSNNPNGFLVSNAAGTGLTTGYLTVNTGSVAGRIVTNSSQDIVVNGHCAIISGELRSKNNLYLAGDLLNNGILTIPSYLILGKPSGNSTVAQTIGGTGVFRYSTNSTANSAFGFQVHNSSVGGVTLQVPLRVQYTYLYAGNVWLGNNDFYATSYSGGGASSMFVTNGTGRVWVNYAGSSANTLPVGDGVHYCPVAIANSGVPDTIGVHFGNAVPNPNNSAKIVNGWWTLSEKQAGGSNISATLQWSANQEAGSFNRAVAYVAQYNGSSYSKLTTGSVSGSNPYTITASGITNLQDYAVGSGSGLDASVSDAIVSTKSGSWNDATVWSTGVVPTGSDAVNINSGHTVTLDADGSCASLTINGTLIASAGTLHIGLPATNNNGLVIYGSLSITGATIDHRGYVLFKSGSAFSMNAGAVVINGNNGNATTSVDVTHALLAFENGVTGNVTGGSITIVNPHLQAPGLAIDGYLPVFAAGSSLQFGDGVASQGSGNNKGFEINDAGLLELGNIVVNTGGIAARIVTVDNSTCYVDGSLTLTSGEFRLTGSLALGGDLMNNGVLTIPQELLLQQYGAAAAAPQAIGGTGVFRNSAIAPAFDLGNLQINNASAGGVTLNRSIRVANALSFVKGKLFLGNNTISAAYTTNGSAAGYVVTDGPGALVLRNVGASPVNFPVGTSDAYNPAVITNAGTADDLSVNVSGTVVNAGRITPYVNAQWNIGEAVPGGSNVTLSLQWSSGQQNSGFDPSTASIAHYDGATWHALTGSVGGSDPYTASASGITSFSPFAITSGATPLPVLLIGFGGKAVPRGVQLEWRTGAEANNDRFDIERSRDGSSYAAIGSVKGREYSTGDNDYNFTDGDPYDGANYYRLRQVDRDGKYTYSPVIAVNYHALDGEETIYPNPVSDMLHINLGSRFNNSRQIRISLYSSTGQLYEVHTYGNPGPRLEQSVERLPRGPFVVEIVADDGRKASQVSFKL